MPNRSNGCGCDGEKNLGVRGPSSSPYTSQMSSTIKKSGGILNEVIEALNRFRSEFGYWPDTVEAPSEKIFALATKHLTPLGFFLFQSRVDLISGGGAEGGVVASRGEVSLRFAVDEGVSIRPKSNAREWLRLSKPKRDASEGARDEMIECQPEAQYLPVTPFQRPKPSKTIKVSNGVTVRFLEAINGFKEKFGVWPEVIEGPVETIVEMARYHLTPLGFFLFQSKLEIRELTHGDMDILAIGPQENVFSYGSEGLQKQGGYRHDARAWLGLDPDEGVWIRGYS